MSHFFIRAGILMVFVLATIEFRHSLAVEVVSSGCSKSTDLRSTLINCNHNSVSEAVNKMFDFNMQFARNGAELSMELFRLLSEDNVKENIIFSPFSVRSCVALAFAGAKGDTADEIANGMKFVSNFGPEVAETFAFVLYKYKDSPLLKIANKIYVQSGHKFKEGYQALAQEFYEAETEELNFGQNVAAAKSINNWVEQKTEGKIKDLISSDALNDLTRLVLLNAVHFKGSWERKFDEAQTAEDDFWISEEETVKVQYMNQKAKFEFGVFEQLDCTALEMPYKNSDLSFLALLPNKRGGVKALAEKLKTFNLLDLSMKMNKEEVVVKFPKFKVDYSVELSDTIKKLGINTMFTSDADFGNMLESVNNIYVSNIMHKASIEVNEEGTEAAAATGMIMMMRCAMLPIKFEADRPFLYMIWNKKNVLFAGAFMKAPST